MNKFRKLLLLLTVCFSTFLFMGCLEQEHTHTLIHVEKQSETCTTDGYEAYDYCTECEYTTKVVINKTGHNMTKYDEVEATLEKSGNSEYYYCDRCEKYFSDLLGENEILENSWVIPQLGTYRISVYDIDNELLGDETITEGTYTNLFNAINDKFTVESSDNGDGTHWIKSINGTIKDNNWSLMLYVDGVESWSSADNIVPEKDKVYSFKNECWAAVDYGYGASMDEIDVKTDIAIYHYLKTELKTTVESTKTFTGSTYWEMLIIDLYKRFNYDSSLLSFTFTDELKASINNQDISKLSGANIGKYFTHAYIMGLVPEGFGTTYETQINAVKSFNSYTTPFMLIPAAYLGTTSTNIDTLCQAALGNTSWGPDGNLWEITSQSLFADRSSAITFTDYVKDWGNNTSNCIVLQATSAFGIDVRDTGTFGTFGEKNLDYLSYIFDGFYDEEKMLLKWKATDTDYVMSSNQIYAGLLAYKCFRDSNKKANIFGPIVK